MRQLAIQPIGGILYKWPTEQNLSKILPHDFLRVNHRWKSTMDNINYTKYSNKKPYYNLPVAEGLFLAPFLVRDWNKVSRWITIVPTTAVHQR